MKLVQATITNFKSIVDSGPVDIESKVSVFIGKNEQGKTTFLKGLESFNSTYSYKSSDLPNHLRPQLAGQDAKAIPIVRLIFKLEKDELPDAQAKNIDTVQVIKHFGNNYTFSWVNDKGEIAAVETFEPEIAEFLQELKQKSADLESKLTVHSDRLPEVGSAKDRFQKAVKTFVESKFNEVKRVNDAYETLSTALKSLPGQDEALQQEINEQLANIQTTLDSIKAKLQVDPNEGIKKLIPNFIFHQATTHRIPDEVEIESFIADPAKVSPGMLNLCRAASLPLEVIERLAKSSDTADVHSYEDYHRSAISGGINEFWTQETYQVHFDIANNKLSVSISDGTYEPRIPPTARSEGFQWYLSFYSSMLTDVSKAGKTVFLLDNPALELHVDGQRDIKQFLEEKIAFDSQVLYVTHSPALIDPFNLSQVRVVDLKRNNEGTKIYSITPNPENDLDLLEPVRSAIGTSIIASLMFNEFNILVEGAADKPILEAVFATKHNDIKQKVLINGNIAESKDAFIAQFYQRSQLPFVVFLDADESGRNIEGELKKLALSDEFILRLDKVVKVKENADFELEDIISAGFYHKAVLQAYPEKPVDQPEDTNKKRTNLYKDLYQEQYKIGFNKRRVGETIKRLLEANEADEETLKNLSDIAEALLEKLNSQVQAKQVSAKEDKATKAKAND